MKLKTTPSRRDIAKTLKFYASSVGMTGERYQQLGLPEVKASRDDVGTERRRAAPLERDIQGAIVYRLRIHPLVSKVIRHNSGAISGEHNGRKRFFRFNSELGHSDLCVWLINGIVAYIECKRPGEKPTEMQQRFLRDARASGILCGIATSPEEAIAIIESRGQHEE